jgi:hypothetical protein
LSYLVFGIPYSHIRYCYGSVAREKAQAFSKIWCCSDKGIGTGIQGRVTYTFHLGYYDSVGIKNAAGRAFDPG